MHMALMLFTLHIWPLVLLDDPQSGVIQPFFPSQCHSFFRLQPFGTTGLIRAELRAFWGRRHRLILGLLLLSFCARTCCLLTVLAIAGSISALTSALAPL